MAVIAGKLRRGLADQDAGHQRVAGDVAADPELVRLDVLVADDQVLFGVDRDDRRQLLHLEALGVALADPLLIDQDTRGVNRRRGRPGRQGAFENFLTRREEPARRDGPSRAGGATGRPGGAGRPSRAGVDRSRQAIMTYAVSPDKGFHPRARKDIAPMTIAVSPTRPLGTMVAYGFAGGDLAVDLAIARRLGATVLEILPDWRVFPDPARCDRGRRRRSFDPSAPTAAGAASRSAPPGSTSATPDPRTHAASVDDLKRCIDWLAEAGGTCLVVHPGGLSRPEDVRARRDALARGLIALADHARGTGVVALRREHAARRPPREPDGRPRRPRRRDRPPGDRPGPRHRPRPHRRDRPQPRPSTPAPGSGPRTSTTTTAARTPTSPPARVRSTGTTGSRPSTRSDIAGPIMLECIRHLRRYPETITPVPRSTERLRRE